jgi:hypothetical protein
MVGPPPARTNRCGALEVGALDTEATLLSRCAGILPHDSSRRNQVFAQVWCKVFPLVLRPKPNLEWQ